MRVSAECGSRRWRSDSILLLICSSICRADLQTLTVSNAQAQASSSPCAHVGLLSHWHVVVVVATHWWGSNAQTPLRSLNFLKLQWSQRLIRAQHSRSPQHVSTVWQRHRRWGKTTLECSSMLETQRRVPSKMEWMEGNNRGGSWLGRSSGLQVRHLDKFTQEKWQIWTHSPWITLKPDCFCH